MSASPEFNIRFLFRSCLYGAIALACFAATGCRTVDDPEPPAAVLTGTYVGTGYLGGQWVNLLIQMNDPDSLGEITGAIRYNAVITDFADVTQSAIGDTVRFSYTRDSTPYSAWSILGVTSLLVHFTQPEGIPELIVNREQGGFNMTGLWQGEMYSVYLNQWRAAAMTMDQQGNLFMGLIEADLAQNTRFNITSGATNGSNFQLFGTVRVGAVDYAGSLYGQYWAPDTLTGTWSAGSGGSLDNGEFNFWRSFE